MKMIRHETKSTNRDERIASFTGKYIFIRCIPEYIANTHILITVRKIQQCHEPFIISHGRKDISFFYTSVINMVVLGLKKRDFPLHTASISNYEQGLPL